MTHIIYKEGDTLQIYFCVIFCKTRHHTQVHVTSRAVPFLWPRKEHRWQSSGLILLAIVMTTSAEASCYCCSSSSSSK